MYECMIPVGFIAHATHCPWLGNPRGACQAPLPLAGLKKATQVEVALLLTWWLLSCGTWDIMGRPQLPW